MEDKGTVLLELLKNNKEWQKNFEYVVNAVGKILEEKLVE
jgi:hypothetical protein